MGKIKQGILGGFKGKVGTVIGSSWNGISYMRGQAQSVRNANTPAQQMQRGFFKDLQMLASQLSDEQLQSLFPTVNRGMTRRNMLTRQLAAAATVVDGVKAVDLSLLEGIGNGERIDSPMLECIITEADGQLTISADAPSAEAIGKPAEANFIAVAYNITKRKIGIFNSDVTDPSAGVSIPVGNWGEAGDSVRFFLTYAANGENVYLRGFGSFIIKIRKEKKGRDISKPAQG